MQQIKINRALFVTGMLCMYSTITIYAQNVGIGVTNPTNKLQVGSVGTSNFSSNEFALGNGTNAFAIYQTNSTTSMYSTTDVSIMTKNNGTGYLGINVAVPTNKLQIGSVGNSGFATNDFAIGNGTNAMAIYQTNSSTLIGSTTDIALMPKNNGMGRVGINLATPEFPLQVNSSIQSTARYYAYFKANGADLVTPETGSGNPGTPLISIYANQHVIAQEFDVFSDVRIKNIIGKSNSVKDLETINALRITDYTLKDKVQNGDKVFKKVIAQEVEKVYPQVVSQHVDFIPNVYQLTSKVEKTATGYLLSFTGRHNISKGAKKLRVLLPGTQGMQKFDIVSIPSGKEVIINGTDLKNNKIFVYGEQVDDFRTVDYEGLTTLNISATQELSRLLKLQQVALESQNAKIISLLEEVKLLKEKGCGGVQ